MAGPRRDARHRPRTGCARPPRRATRPRRPSPTRSSGAGSRSGRPTTSSAGSSVAPRPRGSATLAGLPDEAFRAALDGSDDPTARHLAKERGIAATLRAAATIEGSLASADVTGGTAPDRVAAALAAAKERLGAEGVRVGGCDRRRRSRRCRLPLDRRSRGALRSGNAQEDPVLTLDTIRSAPKALLHDHLDGGLRPATIIDLAARVRLPRPAHRGRGRARGLVPPRRRPQEPRALPRDVRAHRAASCRTATRIVRVAAECAEDLAADGVVYAEVRFAPELSTASGPDARRGGRRRSSRASGSGWSSAAAAGRPIVVRALVTAMRQAARSMEIAELAVRWRDDGVVGFDIAGPEAGYRPTRHLDAFEYVRRENFHITIHAGESFGLPSIWEALQICGAERLGHGVRIIDDITVERRRHRSHLGRLAAFVRDTRVPLELCPTSNVHTGRRRLGRGAPDRPPPPAPLPGHGQHRQPADERRVRRAASSRRSTRRSGSAWARWSG